MAYWDTLESTKRQWKWVAIEAGERERDVWRREWEYNYLAFVSTMSRFGADSLKFPTFIPTLRPGRYRTAQDNYTAFFCGCSYFLPVGLPSRHELPGWSFRRFFRELLHHLADCLLARPDWFASNIPFSGSPVTGGPVLPRFHQTCAPAIGGR